MDYFFDIQTGILFCKQYVTITRHSQQASPTSKHLFPMQHPALNISPRLTTSVIYNYNQGVTIELHGLTKNVGIFRKLSLFPSQFIKYYANQKKSFE